MPALATYPATIPATSTETASITTTLYDLVAALNTEVDAEDDATASNAFEIERKDGELFRREIGLRLLRFRDGLEGLVTLQPFPGRRSAT